MTILIGAADVNCTAAAHNAEATVAETYGIDVATDWQATGIRRFQGKAHFTVTYKGKKMGRLVLSIAGRHNVGNATVAAAICTHCGVPWDQDSGRHRNLPGGRPPLADDRPIPHPDFARTANEPEIDSRFSDAGPAHSPSRDMRDQRTSVTLIDDYGHHPTEIRATLLALRKHYRPLRLVCVFQPHQHSRTRFLLDDFARSFAHADLTIVPDIYFVRDSDADRKAVNSAHAACSASRCRNGRDAMYMPTFQEIEDHLFEHMLPGDLIVSMGAGPVWEVTDMGWYDEFRGSRSGLTCRWLPLTVWFGLGKAWRKYLVQPARPACSCRPSSRALRENDIPMFVLGSGANLLVHDEGVNGRGDLFERSRRPEFKKVGIEKDNGRRLVKVGAGKDVQKLVPGGDPCGAFGAGMFGGNPGIRGRRDQDECWRGVWRYRVGGPHRHRHGHPRQNLHP